MVNGVRIVFFSLILILQGQKLPQASFQSHSCFPSSKSISLLPSLNVDNMFSTCRISELAPLTSSSTTFGGIFSFSLLFSLCCYCLVSKPLTCTRST